MNRIRRQFLRLALPLALLTLAALPTALAAPPTRVLFIGNSYTYFNNLPAMFRALAEAGGAGPVEVRMVAPGGWRLLDHLQKGEAREALRTAKWDYVVLQEQSQLADPQTVNGQPRVGSDKLFAPAAAEWAAAVTRAGARPVFYLTWARKAAPEDQAILNAAYGKAASQAGAILAPVGPAWSLVREGAPGLGLFMDDGSHPSPYGTYLAACTLVASIFDRNPLGLPGRISGTPVNLETAQPETGQTAVLADLTPANAKLLQQAAWTAWQDAKRRRAKVAAR